ncbi:MAG: oxidoreductase [Candidatus Poribacteria bacterium]|nr:MAG: oxidoreductase [Candidatus Poribacteria bacterium]
MNRRDFLRTLLLALSAAASARASSYARAASPTRRDALGELLPTRPLGKTGEQVTMLGLGGWHFGRLSSDREAQELLEVALEGGIRFFDSAESYQGGGSESRYGRLLTPRYREHVFLMTKTTARDAATAQAHLDGSLKRLRTDYLDLWQIHALTGPQDVDNRLKNGVLEVLLKAKASGKVRYIGFTGHTRPSAHLRMLERAGDVFDTCQMPVNAADPSYESFVQNVLPELVRRRIAPLAMKSLANGGFFGGTQHGEHGPNPKVVPDRLSMEEAIFFVWSLPVSVLITGPDNVDQLREKIRLARAFQPLDEAARRRIVEKVADMAGPHGGIL